ncbi:MAG: phosphoethanolamine--lipid A transferase EptA [Arachidicoccus sp.]|nr:phosphoethanolamine--lipid A transferase EptA [Arachidicoccus sp.]
MFKIKNNISLGRFAAIMSVLNFFLYHYPFFAFVFKNVDYQSWNGIIIIASLIILMPVANAFAFYVVLFLTRKAGKWLLALTFVLNAAAVYFIHTYSIIVDESMIGNVLDTRYSEASSFFSAQLILYVIFLGMLPAIYIVRTKILYPRPKRFFVTSSFTLLLIIIVGFANAKNWTWIDKNSKQLGGLAMPWSYSVNLSLFYIHKHQQNEKEILLPNATIKDSTKAVVVLVIGESARRANFSLYGYKKNTNPFLSKTKNLFWFDATSSATYTTAGVKSILEYKKSSKLYEILPNYLYRTGVDVYWRTDNWGEPPVHIKDHYETKQKLESECKSADCHYDEVLLTGLKEEILASKKNKIFIILHTSTSHGPTYSKKYPPQFETFKPVCNSVELGECSKEELYNAYDNTIVYTDYILHNIIEDLKQLKGYNSTMIFVSDHGESLGEDNLYMHGVPKSIAPKVQYEIPFIVWVSDSTKQLKPYKDLTQYNVFHSVSHFLGIQSPVYDESMNIYK